MHKNQHIDFMNVDTEGIDYEVLSSNDWNKYRPDYIMVEIHDCENVEDVLQAKTAKLLLENNYKFISKVLCTSFFKRGEL